MRAVANTTLVLLVMACGGPAAGGAAVGTNPLDDDPIVKRYDALVADVQAFGQRQIDARGARQMGDLVARLTQQVDEVAAEAQRLVRLLTELEQEGGDGWRVRTWVARADVYAHMATMVRNAQFDMPADLDRSMREAEGVTPAEPGEEPSSVLIGRGDGARLGVSETSPEQSPAVEQPPRPPRPPGEIRALVTAMVREVLADKARPLSCYERASLAQAVGHLDAGRRAGVDERAVRVRLQGLASLRCDDVL